MLVYRAILKLTT